MSLSDFGRDEREEVLVLTRTAGTQAAPIRDRVESKDTPDTNALRNEVRTINTFLATADIAFVPDGLTPHIDARDRLLKRRFVLLKGDKVTPWIAEGGSSGMAFGSPLRGRRGSTRIDREAAVDLDFSSMFARLAYTHLRVGAPSGNLYAIPDLKDTGAE